MRWSLLESDVWMRYFQVEGSVQAEEQAQHLHLNTV
jgi:hypothetical protein